MRSGASSSHSSPTASWSGTPRDEGLEVLGEDLSGLKRRHEARDLILHVRADEEVQVLEDRLGPLVERIVETIDDVLAVPSAAVPLALGTAERDIPVPLPGGRPVGGIDEVGVAGGADVEIAAPAPRRGAGLG